MVSCLCFFLANQEMERGFSHRFESGKDPRNQGNPMGRSLRSDTANDKINDKINGVFSSLFLPSLQYRSAFVRVERQQKTLILSCFFDFKRYDRRVDRT